jgi:hypothetical protein
MVSILIKAQLKNEQVIPRRSGASGLPYKRILIETFSRGDTRLNCDWIQHFLQDFLQLINIQSGLALHWPRSAHVAQYRFWSSQVAPLWLWLSERHKTGSLLEFVSQVTSSKGQVSNIERKWQETRVKRILTHFAAKIWMRKKIYCKFHKLSGSRGSCIRCYCRIHHSWPTSRSER